MLHRSPPYKFSPDCEKPSARNVSALPVQSPPSGLWAAKTNPSQRVESSFIHRHDLPSAGEKKKGPKHSGSLPPDRKGKNGVERCSWIGAREVVKSCKPVHISNILSKLPTAQRLIKGGGQLFLLHLFFTQMMNCAECDTAGKKSFFFKCANSLLEMRKRGVSGGGWRVEGSEGGLLCFKPHLYSKI